MDPLDRIDQLLKSNPSQLKAEAEFAKRVERGKKGGRPKGRSKRTVSGKGYSYVWVNGKQITEQRYLMQQELGRELLPHEAVFFIDGNRENLSIDNLKLGIKPGYKGEVICPHCEGTVV